MSDYKPISCGNYDRFEVAIMHREKLHLVWQDDNVYYDRVVMPLNLETRSGEEFLLVRTQEGEVQTIRLDRIRKMEPA